MQFSYLRNLVRLVNRYMLRNLNNTLIKINKFNLIDRNSDVKIFLEVLTSRIIESLLFGVAIILSAERFKVVGELLQCYTHFL